MLGKVAIAFLCLGLALINGISGLSVSGNKVLDNNGNPFYIRGVVRPSFEWNQLGQFTSLSDYTLMKTLWKANTVRLPLNQCFWLASGSSYPSTIATQVSMIRGLGMYVILDLHWSGKGDLSNCAQQTMADVNSVTFWTAVANKFKNDTGVMFELYNEPQLMSEGWTVCRNGGNVADGFKAYGMQAMYDAVRATGAKNIVIVGGTNWAFDLSGVRNSPVTGTNIMYATHPYNYDGKKVGNWDAGFGYLTATYPVIATEFGQYCANDNYVSDLLSYMQTKGMHWTAWAWWVGDCTFPSIIADWSGNPAGIAGPQIKAALAAGPPTSGAAAATTTTGKSATTATTATTATATTKSSSTSTTKAASTSTTGSAATGPITMTVNANCNSWWFAIDSFSGSLYLAQSGTQTVQVKDSRPNAPWINSKTETWGGLSFGPPAEFVLPITVKITNAQGKVATMTNAITTLLGGPVTVTTSYV